MEITRKNFSEQMDNIARDLKRSSFVGFDAEFTAILSGECFKHRLFDTNEQRYNNLRTEAGKMSMTQVGLTMFQYERDLDGYMATSYTFHLCPQTFGDIDQSFTLQASTLKFLCKHNFDFNKFIYNGLPYLSKVEEDQIRQSLKNHTLFHNLSQTLELEDSRLIQQHCSEVTKWLSGSEEGTMYIDIENHIFRYILHCEIRLRFPEALTTDSLGNSNKVLIYRDKNVEGAYSAPMDILEKNLMSHLLGFSQIINLLATYQKPIVGHNLWLDTVLLHSQFIGPLPKKYSTFKQNIHKMFPNMYDTKLISHEMGNKLTLDEVWKSNALQDLYEFFSEGKCKKLESGVNLIRLTTPFDVKQSYHEAGWDSFCTGYCFVRLGHWAACEMSGKYRPVGPTEKLAALTTYCNKVNVIRGAVPYMAIVGDDPPSVRPEWLHIKALRERVINISKVAGLLASCGQIDVKPHGSRTALIAASSHKTFKNIMKQFKDSKEYKISKYSVYRHSIAGSVALWGGALITGSLMFYLIQRTKNLQ